MSTYVALLYSIVLGGGKRVVMADLRGMAEDLGYRNCRTLVSTGNLVFETDRLPIGDIEQALETAFEKRFGKHVDIIARTGADWLKLADGNPFPAREGSEVGVRVMRAPLDEGVLNLLERHRGEEKIAIVAGDLWVDFGGKASETRLLSAMTTVKLGIGTIRNANTVAGLAEMIG
ncbi:uncharacterized protein (DUF1697 family) [Neorhizobium galegae]|uniref:DUF1697 domain-containing protein n=1 Tax=Neorhizobium galegae TaxID=399 RepID=UPI0027872C98|nr:DUF1697 domain-containing protein [Neorhizobium galegae]MDQ0135619.1 uncharacterized protein (DUF1697 family) [Neorhizobium galegae]